MIIFFSVHNKSDCLPSAELGFPPVPQCSQLVRNFCKILRPKYRFKQRSFLLKLPNGTFLNKNLFSVFQPKIDDFVAVFKFSYRKIISGTWTDELSWRNSYGPRLRLVTQTMFFFGYLSAKIEVPKTTSA